MKSINQLNRKGKHWTSSQKILSLSSCDTSSVGCYQTNETTQKASENMEISRVDKRNFLVKFGKTENNFINELAFANGCTPEKVIADLAFQAIVNAHAQMRIDEMMQTHDQYWDV